MPADRDLLLGTLAVYNGTVTPERLAEALRDSADSGRPVGDILFERGAITEAERGSLEALAARRAGDAEVAPLEGTDRLTAAELELVVGEDVTVPAGRFRALRPLAEGALGLLSVALDGELNREVALKEIRPERADDRRSRQRFLTEAAVTGGLEHLSIVPVYAAGRHPDGRPFYAMRLVRGRTLKGAITAYHAGKSAMVPADRNLRFRELLGRFIAVCQAAEYAHSRGVVHRDIKPTNVMLGRYGETLVVDWGLAKPTGKSQGDKEASAAPLAAGPTDTFAGDVMGSPAYMPPEQAAGRPEAVSARSDVYSLGATLATLLTGEVPVAGADAEEAKANVRAGRVATRSPAPAGVPRSLLAVSAKAMAFEPADRYPSAAELAREVERYLADEPVAARRDPPASRAARWARKHPGTVAGAAVAGLLMLTFAATWVGALARFNVVLKQERARAEANAADARRAGAAADTNLAAARQAVAKYLVTVAGDERLRDAGFADLRKQLLRSARPFFRKLLESNPGDEGSEAARAEALFRLAVIERQTGEPAAAERLYRECRDAYRGLAEGRPGEPHYRARLAAAVNSLALLDHLKGDLAAAREGYLAALAIRERLVAEDPGSAEHRADLAASHHNLGSALRRLGEADAALLRYGRALETWRRLIADFPDKLPYRVRLGDSLNNLGNLLRDIDRLEESAARHREALAVRQALADERPEEPAYRRRLADAHNYLGVILMRLGEAEKADTQYRLGVEVQARLVKERPADMSARVALGGQLCSYANAVSNGDPAAALPWYAKAESALGLAVGAVPPPAKARYFLKNTHAGRARALGALGRHAEAAAEWDKAAGLTGGRDREALKALAAEARSRAGPKGD